MKISYERLNQIIEEEVTRFRRLNEGTSEDINLAIDRVTDAGKLKSALKAALGNIKDENQLKAIQNIIGKV